MQELYQRASGFTKLGKVIVHLENYSLLNL